MSRLRAKRARGRADQVTDAARAARLDQSVHADTCRTIPAFSGKRNGPTGPAHSAPGPCWCEWRLYRLANGIELAMVEHTVADRTDQGSTSWKARIEGKAAACLGIRRRCNGDLHEEAVARGGRQFEGFIAFHAVAVRHDQQIGELISRLKAVIERSAISAAERMHCGRARLISLKKKIARSSPP